MTIDKHLQGENKGREKEVWEMKKSFFISAGFASVNKDRCKSGLSGQQLGVKRCRCDGMQSLAGRRRTERTPEDARRSRTRRCAFPNKLLTDKAKKDKLLKNKNKRQEIF